MTDAEREEILEWIRAEHRAGRALNLHAVKRRRPDLLRRVYETRPFWGWWQAIRDAGLDYADLKVELEDTVACRICGYEGQQLNAHLDRRHGIKGPEYRARFPGAEIASEARRARMKKDGGNHLLPHWEPLYSDEYMMDRAWRYHLLGHRLRTTWICEHDHNLWQHIHRQGVTWESFVTGLGIPYPEAIVTRPPGISREELLAELRRVRRELGETPKITRLTEMNHLLLTGIRRYFRNYDEALEAAGLPLPDRPFPLRRVFSPEEVLDELRRLAAGGVRITAAGILQGLNRRDLHHAVERMGGYPAVRRRLGLAAPEPKRAEAAHSREELLAAMRKRAAEGRLLTIPSLEEGPDADPELLRSGRRHFPRWIDLLAAAGLEPEHHAQTRARRRREEWIAALRRLHATGAALDRDTARREEVSAPLYRQGCELFRNWERALVAAGLPAELAGARIRTKDRIGSEIGEFHRQGRYLDIPSMKSSPEGLDLYRRAIRAFPSWRKAVAAAGLTIRKPPKPPKPQKPPKQRKPRKPRKPKKPTRRKARKKAKRAKPAPKKAARKGTGTGTGKAGRSYGRGADREGRKAAVLEAIRERDRAKQPLYLRGVRFTPEGMEVYREARCLFRSWKAAVTAAGCASALRPVYPKSKLAEELDLDYPIPEELYETLPSGRRRWRRKEEGEGGALDEKDPPLDPAPPPGAMPRGWRFPKRGAKQRHTPSKAALRKKRKKGRR